MLNLTTLSRSYIIDAIAAAAGVSRSQVHMHGAFPGRRRRLDQYLASDSKITEMDSALDTVIRVTVNDVDSLDVTVVHSLLSDVDVRWEHEHTLRVEVDTKTESEV